MEPHLMIENIRKKWKKEYTICVVSVFVFGLFAHMFKFTNYLPNYDSIPSYYSAENTIHLGRCFLILGCGISSFYDIPWLIGILSLLYLSVSVIGITKIFEIRNPLSMVLTAAVMVTFPAVTCTFAFMYTADGYFFAMMLATLAIYLALYQKGKGSLIAAILMICLSFGMYQAYILYAIVLVLIYGIRNLLLEERTVPELLRSYIRPLVAGAVGAVLYVISYQVLLRLEHVELSDYQGITGMGLPDAGQLVDGIYQAFHDYFCFLFYSERGMTLYTVMNIVVTGLLLVGVTGVIVRKKLYRKPGRLLMVFALALLVPLCTYFYYFISKAMLYHTVMLESIALFYVVLILLFEKGVFCELTERTRKSRQYQAEKVYRMVTFFALLLVVYNFILTANIVYMRMHTSYERSLAVIDRMADRIEQLPEYEDGQIQKLAVVGVLPGSNETIHNFPPDLDGTVPNYIMRIQRDYVILLDRYAGITLENADTDELQALLQTDAYAGMETWPSTDSLAVVSDTLIIKLSDPYYEFEKADIAPEE